MREETNVRSAKAGRSPVLLWGMVAVLALAALVAASVFLSRGPGGSSSEAGATERPFVGGDLHAMAVDPKDPDRVFVGGHGGAAMSDDAGATWRQIDDLEGADPMGWVVDPRVPAKMYAGGHPGFYHSEDGGESWEQDNSGLPTTDVHGLGMNPSDPDTLYASLVGAGLYRSPDAGESWEVVNGEVGFMGPILVHPRDPETLYVAGMDGDFLQSEDGGKNWRLLGAIPGGMAVWVSQSVADPDVLYAAGGGVSRSTDGGKSWQQVGDGLPGGVSTVVVAPDNPQVVYVGVLEGEEALVYRSEDGGESWEARNG